MRAPDFWSGGGWGIAPLLLSPIAAIYAAATARRVARRGWKAPVPVICCGNATAGGAGKTTVALDIGQRLSNRGVATHFLTRGYGGRMSDNNATLPIQEMRAGRREGAGLETTPTYKPGDNNKDSFWVNPLQLLAGKKDEDPNLPDVEPSRDSLTEPPTGYRKPPNGKLARTDRGPNGMKSDREEADPGAYLRSRQ